MTISRLDNEMVVVSHQGHRATFINATFSQMLDWAYGIQHLGRSFI